ncbi:hypothetical protein IWX49DRAFT_603175 [Phyllosticta citricarpa]
MPATWTSMMTRELSKRTPTLMPVFLPLHILLAFFLRVSICAAPSDISDHRETPGTRQKAKLRISIDRDHPGTLSAAD